jgi:hypothetical protein
MAFRPLITDLLSGRKRRVYNGETISIPTVALAVGAATTEPDGSIWWSTVSRCLIVARSGVAEPIDGQIGRSSINNTIRVGVNAGNTTTTGSTFVGAGAGENATADSLVGIGTGAARQVATDGVTAIGAEALRFLTSGALATAVGRSAARNATSAPYVTAIGASALENASTAPYATALGAFAGYNATSGAYVTAVGAYASFSNGASTGATSVGAFAAYNNVSGFAVTAVGLNAAFDAKAANYLTAIGTSAAQSTSTALGTTAVGAFAGYASTSQKDVTAIGYNAALHSVGEDVTVVGSRAHAGFINGAAIGPAVFAGQVATMPHSVPVGEHAEFRFTTAGVAPAPLVVGNIYRFLATSTTTLQIEGVTLTTSGSGSHTLFAMAVQNNVTVIGFDAQPTRDNQVVLGDSRVTHIKTHGKLEIANPTNFQTTVGAAGAASAPPATPAKWLKIVDNTGATFVVPCFNA